MNSTEMVNSLFSNANGQLSGGVAIDLQTCMIAMIGIFLVLVALDLLRDAFGSITASDYREDEYKKYAASRRRREEFALRYQLEKKVAENPPPAPDTSWKWTKISEN